MNKYLSPESHPIRPLIFRSVARSLAVGSALLVWPLAFAQNAIAQTSSAPAPVAPTVRYARSENVNLSEIVSEWRGYSETV